MICLGDVVKLKRPYKPYQPLQLQDVSSCLHGTAKLVNTETYSAWRGFTYGIVVELLKYNWQGELCRVNLHLYDPSLSMIYMGANNIPTYVDFSVMEIELHKPVSELGYKSLPKLTE